VLAALFCGCAGRNHILFMTKSNVGLDFDSKPPTLEVTVSRKEVVIAPTFEGGQTPPVAASFKPKAGAGSGFANFFLGVDQTFTGGDAALAMASLYASNQAPPANSLATYNSALTLTKPPRYSGIFRGVPGAGETRTFIFGTDTTLGLKAAWSGAGGQFPDTVRLGFNRKEFAWAPLSLTTNRAVTNSMSTNAFETYSVKAPSFLATIQSQIDVGASSNGGIRALQYFASGDTATLLALQPAVRVAMIERLDPKAAEAEPFIAGVKEQITKENDQVEKALDWLYGTEAKPKAANITPFLNGSRFQDKPELFKDLTKEQLRNNLKTKWHLEFVSKLSSNVPK
jgi:hypothetical protein